MAFKEYIQTNKLELPLGYNKIIIYGFRIKEEELVRNLQAAQFKYKQTFANILKSYEWKNLLFPIKMTDNVSNFIVTFFNLPHQKKGFLYVGGRDRNFRPLMVIRGRAFADMNVFLIPNLLAITLH